MRKPKSISPSSLAKFEKDRSAFYISYLCETRPEREPQSQPASVGSAFDAFVKAELMDALFGDRCFGELFEKQVEPHNRDFAYTAGRHVMDSYVHCGAFDDLLILVGGAKEEPQFEFDANCEINGVPLFGKPDCRFVHRNGAHVVLDWKVNGFCGKNATSPNKGFALCRDGEGWSKHSRSHNTSHNLYEPEEFMGLTINKFFMEQVSMDWADQLSMYGWMMGEEVGSDNVVVCIEQVVAKPCKDDLPWLRIANHRSRVSAEYQYALATRLTNMWKAIESEYIFTELSKDENEKKVKDLDNRALSMVSDGTEDGDFYAKCAKVTTGYKGR